jgi:hypothetical protein
MGKEFYTSGCAWLYVGDKYKMKSFNEKISRKIETKCDERRTRCFWLFSEFKREKSFRTDCASTNIDLGFE